MKAPVGAAPRMSAAAEAQIRNRMVLFMTEDPLGRFDRRSDGRHFRAKETNRPGVRFHPRPAAGAGRERLRLAPRPRKPRPAKSARRTSLTDAFQPKSDFLRAMQERGFIHQCSDLAGLDEKARSGS